MSTPHERVQRYATGANEGHYSYTARCLDGRGEMVELRVKDLQAVLDANKGYEALMRDAAREAVQEYKRELAEGLEALKRGETEDGIDMLDNVIDGLKEGSL